MMESVSKFDVGLLVLAASLLVIAFSPTVVTDGGFRRAEYRIKLVNSDGSAVEGAILRIEDEQGKPSNHYPAAQYHEENPLSPNSDGLYVFHQTRDGFQFGSQVTMIFGVIPIGHFKPPKFRVLFEKEGTVIHETTFDDLNSGLDFSRLPVVLRSLAARDLVNAEIKARLTPTELDEISLEAEFPIVERVIRLNPLP